jgi:hypothetical protein
MPARRRPKKPKPNSDQPMKSSSPWKARELLMEEESPGCSVGKLSSLERIDREGDPFCLLFLFAT